MLKIWSQAVLDIWILLLEELFKHIQHQQIEEQMNQIVLYLSEKSQPTCSRYISGRIIGILVEIRKNKIQGPIFDRARQLCEDQDYDVRKIMADEVIKKICQNISQQYIEIFMLEKILYLVYDSEINVKCSGIKLLFGVCDLFSVDEQKNRICKIFIELLSSTIEEVFKTMSFMIGKVFQILYQFITKNQAQMQVIFQTLKDYTKHKNDQIRINFAYNFPGILKLTDSKQFDKFKAQYVQMIKSDPNIKVRTNLISSFHEIALIIGSDEAVKQLSQTLSVILRSKEPEILFVLASRIAEILVAMQSDNKNINMGEIENTEMDDDSEEQKDMDQNESGSDYLNDVLELQTNINLLKNWRIKLTFYKEIARVIDLFDLFKFYKDFFPGLINVLKENNVELVEQVTKIIAQFISINYFIENSNKIIETMIKQYKESDSYKNRVIFIEFFNQCSQTFSKQFIKNNGLLCIMDLADDKISNVKIKFCKIIVQIRQMIDDDDETQEEILEKYEKMVKKLIVSSDKEVKEAAKQANTQLLKIDFYSKEVSQEINEWNSMRLQREMELELISQEQGQKGDLNQSNDDIDLDLNDDFCSSGFNYYNYKKKLNMKYMIPKIMNGKRSYVMGKIFQNVSQTSITKLPNINDKSKTLNQYKRGSLDAKSLYKQKIVLNIKEGPKTLGSNFYTSKDKDKEKDKELPPLFSSNKKQSKQNNNENKEKEKDFDKGQQIPINRVQTKAKSSVIPSTQFNQVSSKQNQK